MTTDFISCPICANGRDLPTPKCSNRFRSQNELAWHMLTKCILLDAGGSPNCPCGYVFFNPKLAEHSTLWRKNAIVEDFVGHCGRDINQHWLDSLMGAYYADQDLLPHMPARRALNA